MIPSISVTVLVENTAAGRGLRGEHGLAFWLEVGLRRVLFDTGQNPATLFHNAKRLGIDLATADAVVLSHGHYDHAGGLPEVLRRAEARLYVHPAALARRFSRTSDGTAHEVGLPPYVDEDYLRAACTALTWTVGPTGVTGPVRVTGAIPRMTDFEDTGGDFFLDRACETPDPIQDDQAAFFDTQDGIVVLLGCGHAGTINTVRHVRALTDDRPIHAVIGGMHLIAASAGRLDRTVEALLELELGLIAPAHCTGEEGKARLWSEFQGRWRPCHVGARFEFTAPGRRQRDRGLGR